MSRAEDERFMRRAIELSREGMERGAGGPFGAVLVSGGRIVGEGCNRVTSANDPTAHAEVVAIRAAAAALGTFDLSGCVLYASCEPCPMCLAAAMWARIGRVVYGAASPDAAAAGFDDVAIYREIGRPWDARSLSSDRVLAGEARAVFDAWRAKPDKTPY